MRIGLMSTTVLLIIDRSLLVDQWKIIKRNCILAFLINLSISFLFLFENLFLNDSEISEFMSKFLPIS